ncbi:hypothetical protein ABZ883_26405 [Streptomyces sp. NPDC046977]|uniref:hypothetical protein n=1 Tax=Streptomyces sp. NPDC046977 TaxID=3154703 RepID=UPI0033F5CD6B
MGDVEQGIRDEIDQLGGEETAPGLCAAAIKLAQLMDRSDAPTGGANAATALRALTENVRKHAPVKAEGDAVDGIVSAGTERRAKLRAVKASGE